MSKEKANSEPDYAAVWTQVTESVKERVMMPALWRAMEKASVVLLEENVLIIGFPLEDLLHAQLLQDVRNKNVIEQALTQSLGRDTGMRVIDGTTVQDWRDVQNVEREAARLRAESLKKQATPASATSWDVLSEQLIRRYAETPWRQLPHVQAEFIDGAVEDIATAYPEMMGGLQQGDDTQFRAYGRMLDRLGDRTGMPAGVIAYLVLKRRQAGDPAK